MIDLRSDTVTNPTEAMLDAMQSASFGDDSRDGDPTVMKLEALAAEKTGKEAGVFVPSGTMSNLVAVLAHGGHGGELLADEGAHTLHNEFGGVCALAGLFYRPVPGARGAMDLELLKGAVRRTDRKRMGTALIWMENTHNDAGGAVLTLRYMEAVAALARGHGVPVHLDGARLFNAAVALGTSAKSIAQYADSVCFCVSKGLSAPVGSVLCGTSTFIERARAFRHMVGGNMRQCGPLAAAGIVALENMVERLAEDHRIAKRLAEGLHAVHPSTIDPATVETNIVRVAVKASGRDGARFSAQMKERGVLVSPRSTSDLRFVTHRHIGDAEVDQAITAFRAVWNGS